MFVILIILSGFTFYEVALTNMSSYSSTANAMNRADWKRSSEKLSILTVQVTNTSNLNITVQNIGSIDSKIIWLGLFNQSTTPEGQWFFSISQQIAVGQTQSFLSPFKVTQGQKYAVQLVTQNGNLYDYNLYPSSQLSLSLILAAGPPSVYLGNNMTIFLTVTNNNTDIAVQNLTLSLITIPTGSTTQLLAPPTLTISTLNPGQSQLFTWIYRADSVGSVLFEATYNQAPSGAFATSVVTILAAPTSSQGQVLISGTSAYAKYNPAQWNMLGGTSYVSGTVSSLAANDGDSAVFKSYYSGNYSNYNYFVNSSTTYVDGTTAVGTHSNFAAMQTGPNSTYDTLTEANTFAGAIAKVGTDTSTNAYQTLTLSFSHTLVAGSNRMVVVCYNAEEGGVDVTGVTYGGVAMTNAVSREITGILNYNSQIWYLLEASLPATGSQTVSVTQSGSVTNLCAWACAMEYTGVTQGAPEATNAVSQTSGATITNTISPSTGSWVISAVGNGNPGSFNTWSNSQVEIFDQSLQSTATMAVGELRGASGQTSLNSVFSGTVNRMVRVCASWKPAISYQLNLQTQWTNVNYTETNEVLAIYLGSDTGSDNLVVDVWNGAWQNVFSSLSVGWNNVTVSSYLTSSTFTVRFTDSGTNNLLQSTWNIDVALLHVWEGIDQYTTQTEFTGSSNNHNWTSFVWNVASSWSASSISVSIQFYNYTSATYMGNGSGCLNYTSSSTAGVSETKSVNIVSNTADFKDNSGNWKVRITATKYTSAQFSMNLNWTEIDPIFTSTGGSIPYGAWQIFTITSTSSSGGPTPYVYVSIYANGTSVAFQDSTNATIPNPSWVQLDSNGTYLFKLQSTNATASETFALFASVGTTVGQKTIVQEAT